MLSLLALSLLTQCGPEGPIFSCPSTMRIPALFEFAPLSGAGMGAACACTTPTGAKGEVLTFSRASTAYCTKGNETTGIVNGDLVECASGQPRVMPGGAGTGGLGLSLWEARTNLLLRSQEIDNAAWIHEFSGATTAVVTADFAVAPDGTTTADRVQFPAVSAGQYTLLKQIFGAATYSGALYLKGNGTSGSLSVWLTASGSGCQQCAYNATTWTRCVHENQAAATTFYFGNDALDCGVAGAQDVLVWQADLNQAATIGPPIKTTSAAATRVLETATFPAVPAVATSGSAAATVVSSVAWTFGSLIKTGTATNGRPLTSTTATGMSVWDGTVTQSIIATFPLNTANRFWSSWSGATETITQVGGATSTGAFDGTMGADVLEIGTSGAGPIEGVIKQVCLDPSPTRCR